MGTDLAPVLLAWYAGSARELPWRGPGRQPWEVLVSEVMLQQTPVARVRPVYEAWCERWPGPAALAAAPPGEAIRMWGRLGYPRRALRLHDCARILVERFDRAVPSDLPSLLSLPGVGAYTARAVAAFAFGQRHAVVDTNVRRVVARVLAGQGAAGPPSHQRDRRAVETLLPAAPARAARFSVALMEFGALVCTARAPRCGSCPLATQCSWRLAGSPEYGGPVRPPQRYAGTDRQARGALLAVLRSSRGPVSRSALEASWHAARQRARALSGLLADGLVTELPDGRYTLPGCAGTQTPGSGGVGAQLPNPVTPATPR